MPQKFITNMGYTEWFLLIVFAVSCIVRNCEAAPNVGAEEESTNSRLLYPVDEDNDRLEITNENIIHSRPLSLHLPFFRHRFCPSSTIQISRNGYVEFIPPTPPETEESGENPLIGVLMAPQELSSASGSGVFLKVLEIENDSNDELSGRLRDDFRQGMIGAANFEPKNVIIVTWRNLTLSSLESSDQTNTYQLVLATDGRETTFAMLNYDHLKGVAGDQGKSVFVGFKTSSNRSYSYPTYSQSSRIAMLANKGFGNGLRGRHYFQVDEQIYRGSCLEKRYDMVNESDHLPLTIFPLRGNMLGGNEINVTGPCLEPNTEMHCHFGKLATVPGIYRDINHASCIVPVLSYHGYLKLSVSTGNTNETYFAGNYYIQSPELAEIDVNIVDSSGGRWGPRGYPTNFVVQWDASKLPKNTNGVRIAIWGITSELGYLSLKYIDEINSDVIPPNVQEYEVNVQERFAERWNPETQNLTHGYLSIDVLGLEGTEAGRRLWSGPMSLAWYFTPQWRELYGDEANETFCRKWIDREESLPPVVDGLPSCPCTVEEADMNIAYYMVHDICNPITSQCLGRHRGSWWCFESAVTSLSDSSQTCCYDTQGELIRSADTLYSGAVERSAPFGREPFNGLTDIPAFSIAYNEDDAFSFCTKWEEDTETELHQSYQRLRPSTDCTAYKSPIVGSLFGNTHIKTFSGLTYTFGGKGEFVLVRDEMSFPQLQIQGRFEEVRSNTGNRATYLSAIVARTSDSATVEFRIRPYEASWKNQMDVIVDKNYVAFSEEPRSYLFFKGVALNQPLTSWNLSMVTATFDTGVGIRVQVIDRKSLSVIVVLDESYKNHTKGLLGNYHEDDFVLPDGSVALPATANAQDIHNSFTQKWRLSETYQENIGSSLFYHDTLNWSYYDDVDFEPTYLDSIPNDLQPEVTETCGDSSTCSFDYIVTNNRSTALNTKIFEENANRILRVSREKAIRCPELPRPVHGSKSVTKYFIGTTVEFSCDEGYTLTGTATRTCEDTAQWSPGTPVVCTKND